MVSLLGMLSLLGCSKASESGNTAPGLRKIQLQLNWLPDAQHGGFYAAKAAGYFSEAGLDVEIIPGGPGTAVLPKLAMGRCDFAIGNADQVLLARAQDADVVAVFAAMQNSPRCIIVHEKSGIENFEQLNNLTLAVGDGKAYAEYLKSLLPLTNVRIVSYTGSVAKFLIEDNFAQQGYSFSEPIAAKMKGGDPRCLMVSDLGFNPYASVVVTRNETIQQDAELVKKFVEAIRKGWQTYLDSPDAANDLIREVNTDMKAEMLSESAKAIHGLCLPDEGTQLGAMEESRWTTLRSQLVKLDLLPESAAPATEAFVAP